MRKSEPRLIEERDIAAVRSDAMSARMQRPSRRYRHNTVYELAAIWAKSLCGINNVTKEPQPGRSGGKIIYVIDCLDLGGAEQHLSLITPRLKQLGWQPLIYCLRRAGVRAPELREAGVQVIGPPIEMRNGLAGRLLGLPLFAMAAVKLLFVMKGQRPAIAHFFLPASYLIGAPLSLIARVPVKIMSRRITNGYQSGRPFVRKVERFLHKRMTAVLANSKPIVQELVHEEGCPLERVGLIHNGVDVAAFGPSPTGNRSRENEGIEPKEIRFIIVANLAPRKGHADLLDGLAAVSTGLPKSWTLQCVGRDDGCRRALTEQARRLGIDDNIRFLGARTDVPRLLKRSHIGVLSSHEEGFSNALLEAMAAGMPMVVTDVGGNAEAVVHKKTGFVVPARSPQKLGTALLTLAKSQRVRRAMGQAARKRVGENFTIEACVEKYDRLYTMLLKGEPVGSLEGIGAPLPRKGSK